MPDLSSIQMVTVYVFKIWIIDTFKLSAIQILAVHFKSTVINNFLKQKEEKVFAIFYIKGDKLLTISIKDITWT